MRGRDNCQCDEGWTGVHCNVCTEDKACNALLGTESGGVCYQNGEVVNYNHQICDVTNKKIVKLLNGQKAEVTFTCKEEQSTCDFQCRWLLLRFLLLLLPPQSSSPNTPA